MHTSYILTSEGPSNVQLAHQTQAMHLDVARKSFIRIRDVRHVELVNRTEVWVCACVCVCAWGVGMSASACVRGWAIVACAGKHHPQ